jgi:hypothetical protein
MGRTEQRLLVAGSIVFLLAVSATTGTAASDAFAATTDRVSSASPAAFAERITADGRNAAVRDSWQNAIALIVLTGICATAVAFYSAATAQRTDTPVPVRVRRR